MKTSYPLSYWILIILIPSLLLNACRETPPETQEPIAQPERTTSPDVLAACDTSAQDTAMLPEHTPAWAALGLSACYDLHLDLQPNQGKYSGRAEITFTNLTGEAIPDLVFRTYPNSDLI